MWSSSPVCARPVRTLPRSPLNAWMVLSIFCSVVFFKSAITICKMSTRLAAMVGLAPWLVWGRGGRGVETPRGAYCARRRGGVHPGGDHPKVGGGGASLPGGPGQSSGEVFPPADDHADLH